MIYYILPYSFMELYALLTKKNIHVRKKNIQGRKEKYTCNFVNSKYIEYEWSFFGLKYYYLPPKLEFGIFSRSYDAEILLVL